MNSIPQADVKDVLCRLRGVQGATQVVPYIAGYTDSLTYNVDVYSSEGWMRSWDGVIPVGQRWPRPFLVRPPNMAEDGPEFVNKEAWARGMLYNDDLFLFVTEIPDWAACIPTDDTPPTDDAPPGSTDGPAIIVPRPLRPQGLGMLARIMLNSSPAELKALSAAIDAVRESA